MQNGKDELNMKARARLLEMKGGGTVLSLAATIGCNRGFMSRILAGKRSPPRWMLKRLGLVRQKREYGCRIRLKRSEAQTLLLLLGTDHEGISAKLQKALEIEAARSR